MENTPVRQISDSIDLLYSNNNSPILLDSESKETGYHEVDSGLVSPGDWDENPQQESHFSFDYISELLMDDDLGDQSTLDSCSALQTTQTSFLDVLHQDHHNPSHHFVELNTEDELGNESKIRKYQGDEDCYCLDDERSNKHAAIYAKTDFDDQLDMFDSVLLISEGSESDFCGKLESNQNADRGKIEPNRSEGMDLNTILIDCAQAVSRNDLKEANETLKKIRQLSSPVGNAAQRSAHYFANGLEARMAGTGRKLLRALRDRNMSVAEGLRCSKLYFTAYPFKSVFDIFRAVTIVELSKDATSLHIVDFGILYGFPWPCLIQCLSAIPGGPPKLRVTGIDLPKPGFRPAERVEETGRLLAVYCERFKVPFEYTPIVKKLDTVQLEDLKIDRDEVTVASCFGSLRVVPDETTGGMSSRDRVLELIRKINPDVFIHAVTNGSYGGPYFMPRFREALFHFSSMFDMFEATMSCDEAERMLCEKQILEWNMMNVIACEGIERVERPETYMRSEARNVRMGLRQLPLKEGIVEQMKAKLKIGYHKDFMVSKDAGWLLQGWKGRVLYAISCWRRA